MKFHSLRWCRLTWVVLLLIGRAFAAGEIKPTENLVVEGVPPIPASLATELRPYTESRAASFGGWHPTKLAMLIGTRFGNTAQVHAVEMPLGMRKQLTFSDEPVGSQGYDGERGDYFLFRRDQGGSEFAQLYRYDLKDGATTLLTDGGRSQNGGVVWSHDGRMIAYGSTRRNGADRDVYVMDPRDPKSDRRVLELSGGGWGVTDWSRDGKTLLVLEYISVNESHVWRADLAAGTKSPVTPADEKQVAYGTALFAPEGRGVFVTTDRDAEFQRLAYIDLGSGKTEFLTEDLGGDVESVSLAEDGKRLVFIVNENGVSRVYLMDTASRKYRRVDGLPPGVVSGGEWHRDNRHIAFDVTSATIATDVFVLDADTGAATRWTESELGGIVASNLREAELVRWKSFDGREITGFLFRPGVRFTGRRPVIINIHGGPESQALPLFQARNNYYMNELGAAMIYPNVRGSTGFGKTYVALDNGRLREDSVKDIGALLDWIAQQPDLDASRIMITGGSYGGYMTLACATHYSDRVRCFVDVVGISNFVTFLEKTESYRRDLRRVEYGDERDPEMRKLLEAISPTNHVDRIKSPLFIIQGANDPRVPRGESVQMTETIRKSGGAVWYLEAKDEGHGFAKKGNRDFQFYATVMFVKKYLLDEGAAP